MPIYEYQCPDCNVSFEALRKFSDADIKIPCPNCQQTNGTRKLSRFNAVSDGKPTAGSANSCSSCAGGNCASCH